MNDLLKKAREWMNSPEFEESINKFAEKIKAEDERKERYILIVK